MFEVSYPSPIVDTPFSSGSAAPTSGLGTFGSNPAIGTLSPVSGLAAYGGDKTVSSADIIKWPAAEAGHATALADVVSSGRYHRVNHPIVSDLEARFAAWSDHFRVRAVGSGTAALHVALDYNAHRGPKVMTSALNWPGAVGPMRFAGLEPVFVDVNLTDASICEDAAIEHLSEDVGAVLITHLFGNVVDAPRLRQAVRIQGRAALIDDCAQAITAVQRHRELGVIDTDAIMVSGNGAKHMGAGELGFVCGTDEDLIEHVDRVSLTSSARNGERVFSPMSYGLNYRPNVFSSAVARDRLQTLSSQIEGRMRNASTLAQGLSSLEGLSLLHDFTEPRNAFLNFALMLDAEELDLPDTPETRDFIVNLLLEEGVPVWVWLRKPVWAYLPAQSRTWNIEDFPNTKKILNTMFYITEVAPPNDVETMTLFVEAFHKVWRALPALRADILDANGRS